MLCIFQMQMQLKTNNLNVEPGLQPRRKFWVWCFLMSLNQTWGGVDDISGMESAHFLHQQVERRADHLRWTEGADTMENIQEWEEAGWEERGVLTVAVMWHRWMLGGRDDTALEIGDTKVMGWWHLILGGAQHCHLVSYCQHHHHHWFTKDRMTNIGCL